MNNLQILLDHYPTKPWDFAMLSKNPNYDFEYIEKNKLRRSFTELSRNPSLTIQQIKKNFKKWNYEMLSLNPNLTIDFVREYKGT